MVGTGEGAIIPPEAKPPRAVRAAHNWFVAILMVTLLIAAIAGVVVALSSGMPTVAIVIALVSGAVFAGVAC
ncbi:hypothetical protein JDV09_08960 [Mycobacterium sp. Y57]|uniref:hypothetical protein n=1 Tax=Mycolicibacterium xanthum TaxID=2796469 RepID=UPI001C86344F|nr:hypothetical protein [Mycolicibacterium xanthum]MBX7432237.1 hypothetical protein [Mycolicibacterium xanthum]